MTRRSLKTLTTMQRALRAEVDIMQGGPMKAHDVRHLCICEGCNKLADDRTAIHRASSHDKYSGHWHTACFYDAHGDDGALALPPEQSAKFRLCDVPIALMKTLVKRRDP